MSAANSGPPVRPPAPRRLFLKFAGFGAGVGLVLAVAFAVALWRMSRPSPPPPPLKWNKTALTATFDSVRTQGKDNELVFYYTLTNHTEDDYEVSGDGNNSDRITLVGGLAHDGGKEAVLSRPDPEHLAIRRPIFLPAHRQARAIIDLKYHCDIPSIPDDASDETVKEHRRQVSEYLHKQLPNFEGFDMFDTVMRYEVRLPSGW